MGKPAPNMFEVLRKVHNLDPSRCMMVGDRSGSGWFGFLSVSYIVFVRSSTSSFSHPSISPFELKIWNTFIPVERIGLFFSTTLWITKYLVVYHFHHKLYVSYLKVKHCRAIDLHIFKYDLVDCTVPVDRRSDYSAISYNHLHYSSFFFSIWFQARHRHPVCKELRHEVHASPLWLQ